MNPFVNAMLRLTGIAPLVGPMPLTFRQYDNLFEAKPSFVDYFPIVDYDRENKVFVFDDRVNVGLAWELTPRDCDAKPEETLEQFNIMLAKALIDLPLDETIPYTVQIFLENAEIENLGTQMKKALPEHLQDDQFSNAVVDLMRDHSNLLTHEFGLFQDKRVAQGKGWRVSTQRIFMLIYRIAPESYWKKQRKSPTQKIIDDTRSIIMALNGLKVGARLLDDYDLIHWLAPIFSHGAYEAEKFDRATHDSMRQLSNYDIGQQCFRVSPRYYLGQNHEDVDDFDRGIYRFGDQYLRYLTTEGLQQVPNNGCLTIAQDDDIASVWEQMPPGSMMTWTIVPQTQQKIDSHIEQIEMTTQNSTSDQVTFAKNQISEAKRQRLENGEYIYYSQIGIYLAAPSIEELHNKTHMAMDVIKGSHALSFIKPEHDLISQDAFKYSLPFVYDFEHDRKNCVRARMTYVSQLAATLPLYGVGKGSKNLCYIMYKRSGEPFMYNPYIKTDRVRVAHQLVFGPTGAGKSAAMIKQGLMSMAVNCPRLFILDKGNSFGLLADYAESLGKKVKRYTFNSNSNDTFPPFFETQKALQEISTQGIQSAGDDDEIRSYIVEMLNSLKIMVSGGSAKEISEMKQADINFLQKSLIAGLQHAVDKGKKHATISDVHEQMHEVIKEEPIETFKVRFRTMADSLELWTQSIRGKLFNQIGEGFDETADLTLIETGALAEEGSADMFAVAGLATMSNITALGERCQYDKRHIEVILDEAHYWMKLLILINGIIQATKVWRKLGIWLTLATQDFSDIPLEAKKILTQAEFWLLLSMEEEEAQQISRFKDLTPEEHHLIRQAIIEKPNFAEATLISKQFGCGLNRLIPPSLVLALAQTEKDEKAERQLLMQKHDCTELEAAFMIADNIEAGRRKWQESHDFNSEFL